MTKVGQPIMEERSRLLTLVFTDLVNSVGLKTRLGDAEAGRLIAAHHGGVREILQRCGGREIMVAGDGSFLTFETPSQAVEFALELQEFHRENGSLPSVRIGIHMGEVTERLHVDSGNKAIDIEGLAVDIASRIQSLACPRQILMSYPVFDNARQRLNMSDLPSPVEWRAHGRYIFQGSDMALEVFEVGVKGLSPFSPPTGSTKAHRDVHGEEEATLGWRPAQGLELPARPNWILQEKLGEGGFGDVWMVEHRKTRERHVIKFCYSTDRLRALKREVTLFRLLKETLGDRQDIARVMDYQFESPPYFLEMEFAGRHNLTNWLQEHGGVNAIPLEVRLELVAQVADAIAAAHSVGVLHKDIKPSNIMVTESGSSKPRIRMIDFGIGAVADRNLLEVQGITATGLTEAESNSDYASSLTGTRLYMAPELIEGKAATTKSDIYSLGVVLYQMASGKIGQTLSFGWERDISDEILRKDIEACVDGRPENRLVSAEELANRLRSLPERRAAREKLEHDLIRLESSRKRRKLYIAAGIALAVLLVFIAQFALLQKQKADTATHLKERAEIARMEALQQTEKTQQALGEAHRANYFGAIALAEASLREHRLEKVQEVLLNDAPPEYRNREWGWLLAQTSPEDFSLKHFDIFDTKISPDGKTFIAGARDFEGKGFVSVYDIGSGKRLQHIRTNDRLVWNLAVSPDGRQVATASSDKIVAIVDLPTSTVIHRLLDHTDIVRDVDFSPDGTMLATCSRDKTIHIWNTKDYQTSSVITVPGDNFTEIDFSPDSRYIVSGSLEGAVRVFDAYTGEQRVILAEHTDRVLSACFLHDSSGIATACTDGVLRVYPWPPREGEKVLAPKLSVRMRDSYPAQVVSAPDGKSVYMANDNGTIKKLDTATGLELQSLQVDQQLWKICLSHDGKHLFTTARWSMRMLDLERLEGGGEVTDWTDMETTPAEALPIHIATIVNTRDQTWKADSMWRTTTGLSLVKVKDRQFFAESAYTVYSPDRTQCIKINPTTLYANVRSTKDNKLIRRIGRHAVLAACFSPDGKLAAIGNMTSGTVVYDTKTWKQQYTLQRGTNGPGALLFSPDSSKLAEGNVDGSIRLFNSRDGSLIKELVKPGRSAVLSLDFSKEGGLLAAGLEVDRAIVLNLQTGEQVSTMTGHVRYVHALKFAPKGDRLATLSRDGTAKLWDVESGRELVTLYSLPQGVVPLGIVFSSNGRFIAAATSDKRVIVTDVFPWNAKTYGAGPEGMDDRVELWKRRTRMNPNITMDDVMPPKS